MASQDETPIEFVDNWNLCQTLGEGAYGEVKLLIHRNTGEAIAMKMIDLKKHPDAGPAVKKEVCIHKFLKHPNILRYFGNRTEQTTEYIFLEYAAGGELFDRIEPDVGMTTEEARRYFIQIIAGIEFMHSRGIAHRDIKPENILLDDHDNIKISDFGMATIFRMKGKERLLDKKCGTMPYVAPEVLIKPYKAEPADLWSCGIVLVAMLGGELPWDSATISCKEYLLWKENQATTITPWTKMDTLSLNFLRKILVPNPEKRLTIEKIKQHKWCQSQGSTTGLSKDICDAPAAKRLKSNLDLINTNLDDSHARMFSHSQPPPMLSDDDCKADLLTVEARNDYCFSQPTMLDDLLVSSQLNGTQGSNVTSNNPFQRLVKRMTRFFVTTKAADIIRRLTLVVDRFKWTWKIIDESSVIISTVDRRKLQLIFKANLIEMDGKILLDFRLSKGCGLDFKRNFLKIKDSKEISEVVLNIPVNFSLATAVV